MKHLRLLFSLLLLCGYPFAVAYSFFDKDLRLLTMQDGLADNNISCIYKDKDDFMWFGTNNGLSRYDGKTIRNFSPSSAYLSVDEISELSDHCLGIISGNTLYCFDRITETFIPMMTSSDSSVVHTSHILPIDENSFWALAGNRLVLYEQKKQMNKSGRVTSIQVKVRKEHLLLLNKQEVYSAICYSSNQKELRLVTNLGKLLLFNPDVPNMPKIIEMNQGKWLSITSLSENSHFVWITTVEKGIIRYYLPSGQIDHISYGGKGKEGLLSHTDVFQIVPLSHERYLAATWSGYTLLMLDKEHPDRLTTEIYNNTHSQLHRNLETRMISAYYDPDGILWIGTNGGGVLYSDLRSQFYTQFHQERHNEICGITMDLQHRLFLATFHQGILRSDKPFNPSKRLQFSSVESDMVRAKKTVLCTTKDSEGNLWFGNRDGTLTFYNVQTEQWKVCTLPLDGAVNEQPVWALLFDSKQRCWIGTEKGLLQLNVKSGRCKQMITNIQVEGKPTHLSIRALAETRDGTIWIGTSSAGICKLQVSHNGKVSVKSKYESRARIAYNSVRSLLASSDGNLYIGYMDGFGILSPEEDAIKQFYTTHDGLCSNFIGWVVEDGKGRIWLGSNSGVSRYSRHQHLFYNYYISGSNRSALFSDKMLFLGNNKSLTYFNPEALDVRFTNDKVLITGLEVNNRLVSIGEEVHGQTILQQGIAYTHSLILNNENRDFSLNFNNLSYSEEQQKYNYRLLPYQKTWLVANAGEKASYTNLPAGDYTFEVQNIYPDNKNGKTTSLQIQILPHWSRTVAFRFILFLLLVAAVAYIFRWIKIRQRRLEREMHLKHELLTVSLEREKERQVRVERENFFTSAAHELRTPLTLILSPLQEVLQQLKPSDPIYTRLLITYKNGTSLHTLIDHLLYVQKIEAGMIKLQLSEVDIIGLVHEVAHSFRQIAETKKFHFEVKLQDDPLLLWIDVEKIASSVRNLLSNAFKYTSSGGTISLSVSRTVIDGNRFCQITVSDTGIGIPAKLQERIFDSFITGDSVPDFSTKIGIGLRIVKNTMNLHHGLVTLESDTGKGSTFVLSIPEGKAHFANDVYETVNDGLSELVRQKEVLIHQPTESSPKSVEPTTKKCLLIIEDNADVREYIRSLFLQKYTVLEATDGEEGVRIATEQLPECILSDVIMPVKDGFTCCREIREQSSTAHIPILMLTAKAKDTDALQASRCGADDYMMKPFNPELLKAKVESLILQRERLKRIYTKALMLKQAPESDEIEDAFVRKVINVIEAHLSDENLNVKMLADKLNMSQPTLYRKMKQCSELAVVDMIRSVRMSKAASLLMENRYSIQEVSERVGYSDVRTLRKHFTEQFGVPPSKYGQGK